MYMVCVKGGILPHKNNQHGGTLLGMAIGLALGLLIALGVVWYLDSSPKPFVEKVGKVEPPQSSKLGKGGLPDPNASLSKETEGLKKDPEHRFSYDKVLSKGETKSPVTPPSPAPAPPSASSPAPAGSTTKTNEGEFVYYVQAGSFISTVDADKQKAAITLMGLDALVEPAQVEGKGTVYRVKVGPHANLEEANAARATLSQNKIESTAPQRVRKLSALGANRR